MTLCPGEPSSAYLHNYAVMQRRIAFCHVTANALRRDYDLSLEAALQVLVEVPVADGDLMDPKYRAHFEAQAEAVERAKETAAERARAAGGGEEEIETAREAAGAAAHNLATPVQYDKRDVINEAAFIAEHVEKLRKCGGLVPGSSLPAPPIVATFRTLLRVTKKREAHNAKAAARSAARAAARVAARAAIQASKPPVLPPPPPVPLAPRAVRGPPPAAGPAVPEGYGASPALVAETLALWDLTQVHGAFLQLPPCPWPRFCRAFLAPRTATEPKVHGGSADATLIRDVCVALVRVAEVGLCELNSFDP